MFSCGAGAAASLMAAITLSTTLGLLARLVVALRVGLALFAAALRVADLRAAEVLRRGAAAFLLPVFRAAFLTLAFLGVFLAAFFAILRGATARFAAARLGAAFFAVLRGWAFLARLAKVLAGALRLAFLAGVLAMLLISLCCRIAQASAVSQRLPL